MSDLDLSRIEVCWRDAADADVSRALSNPDDYPDEVRAIIAAEARRRGVNAGEIEPFESPLARHGKRGLAAANGFIQSHRVLCALVLGIGLSLGVVPLSRFVQGWLAGAWLPFYASICALGLCIVSLPLRSYRDTWLAALAGGVGNLIVNLVFLAVYFPRGTPFPWYKLILYAVTSAMFMWVVAGGLVSCAIWAHNRYHPLRSPGYCVQCGYNLRGLPQPRCPECGQAFDPAQMRNSAGELSPPTASG